MMWVKGCAKAAANTISSEESFIVGRNKNNDDTDKYDLTNLSDSKSRCRAGAGEEAKDRTHEKRAYPSISPGAPSISKSCGSLEGL